MPTLNSFRRNHLRAAALLVLLLPPVSHAENPSKLTGTLNRENGVPVLRLSGDAHQRGYTHGYLLGREIRTLYAEMMFSPAVWGDVQRYEQGVRKEVVPLFTFTAEERRELEGMLAGMRDRVGAEGLHVESVERAIDLIDLMAGNLYADLQNGGCTSFAAWGPATRDGGTIVGRNLDFRRLPSLAESQLLIVYNEVPTGGKRWMTVSWPGMIGAYTAMNEDGVFVSMHDVRAATDLSKGPFVPRGQALRRIMESVGATGTANAAASILRKTQAFCGNNFLVAAPFTGQPDPVVVFEYDADTTVDGGATMRTAAWNDHMLPANTIACTNHYRQRAQSSACDRYAKVRRVLRDHPTGEIDAKLALEVQRTAAVDDTLHTVIALPNRKELTVSFCTDNDNATASRPVTFTLDELFDKSVATAN